MVNYQPRHALSRLSWRARIIAVICAVLAVAGGGIAAAVGASAASASVTGTTTYSKAFDYQFTVTDSTTTDSPGLISDQPFTSDAEATQSLGANGVTVSTAPQTAPAKGCCDSGVLVKLGDLNSLFDSSGTLKPISITGSGAVYANWIFDSDFNGKPLNFNANGTLIDAGGDNYAYSDKPGDVAVSGTQYAGSFSLPGHVADSADFATVLSQGNNAFSSKTYWSLEQIHKAFVQGDVTNNVGADPTVWLDVAVSGTKAQTATITSVNGKDLVNASTPASAPTVGPVSSFTDYSASCLDNSNFTWKDGNLLQLWRCGVAGGVDQNFKFATVGGHQVLEAVAPAGKPQGPWCVTTDMISRDRLQIESCTGATGQEVAKSGPYYMFTGTGLVMDDAAWNTHNGAKVIGYPKNNGRNQRWSLP